MTYLIGVDIGGTKCAVSLGIQSEGEIKLLEKRKFPTCSTPEETISQLLAAVEDVLK